MFCNNCGAQNPDGANNCSNCGASLNNTQQTSQPAAPVQNNAPVQPVTPAQPQKPKNNKGLIIGIVAGVVALIAIVAVVLVFVLGGDKDKDDEKDGSSTTKAAVTQDVGDKDKDNKDNNSNDKQNEKEPSTNPSVQTPANFWGGPVTISTVTGDVTFPYSTTLSINGKQVTFPCKLSDFLADSGLSLDEYDADKMICPGDYELATAIGNGIELELCVADYYGGYDIPITERNSEIPITEGIVFSAEFYDEVPGNAAISVVPGIKIGTTVDEVIAIIGNADDEYADGECIELYYYKELNDYEVVCLVLEFDLNGKLTGFNIEHDTD